MAPPRPRSAIAAVGIVAGIALHGCGDLASHVQSMIETACKTSVSGIINSGRQHWIEQVTARCEQLRDHAQENLLNEEKANELYQHCIDTAGGTLEEDADAQEDNFTKECLARFQGLNGTMNPMAAIQEWMDGTDFSGMFESLLEEHLGNNTLTLDELKEQYPDLFDDAEDTSGGDADDTSGGDADDISGGDADDTSGGDADDTSGDDDDEETKSSGGDADDTSGDDDEEKKSSGGDADDTSGGKGRLRLFDVAVRLPHSPKGSYAVLSCLLGCALAAAVGLAVVLRRRKARASDHDSLIDAEDSE